MRKNSNNRASSRIRQRGIATAALPDYLLIDTGQTVPLVDFFANEVRENTKRDATLYIVRSEFSAKDLLEVLSYVIDDLEDDSTGGAVSSVTQISAWESSADVVGIDEAMIEYIQNIAGILSVTPLTQSGPMYRRGAASVSTDNSPSPGTL